MFGFEDGVYLRQNLANAFIVNYLWLPTLLAIVTLVLIFRRRGGARCSGRRRCCVGLAAIYAWTTLTYPTFTEPRYATPVIMLTMLIVFIGLGLWPRRGAAGRSSAALLLVVRRGRVVRRPIPVSREIWGTRASAARRSTTPRSASAGLTA